MIDFRYLLVTIAAVFLAIATGLVLGAGPLNDAGRSTASDVSARDELRGRLARAQQRADYAEQVAKATGTEAMRERLDGRRVAIVALPGADGRSVRGISDLLTTAGATVTRSLQITDKWVDPRQRQFLDDLSADLVTDEVQLPEGSAYDRAATVLANAVLGYTEQDGTDADSSDAAATVTGDAGENQETDSSTTILGAYDEGRLVRSGTDKGPADLSVVVAPDPKDHDPNVERSDGTPWLALARAFDRAGDGAVVAGPGAAARGAGALCTVRSNAAAASEISTVDVADRPVGPAVVTLALAEQAEGRAGHYGMVGPIDGALPG